MYTPETQQRVGASQQPTFTLGSSDYSEQTHAGAYHGTTQPVRGVNRPTIVPTGMTNESAPMQYAYDSIMSTQAYEQPRRSPHGISMVLPVSHTYHTLVANDVRVDVYNKSGTTFKSLNRMKDKLFHFWFNTYFLCTAWESKLIQHQQQLHKCNI